MSSSAPNPHDLPILNLAGPITGLLIQPLIGALSDRTWSPRWGRRKPFFLIGAIGCSLCLFLFPFVTAVWMAVILLWLLDASNNSNTFPAARCRLCCRRITRSAAVTEYSSDCTHSGPWWCVEPMPHHTSS